MQKEFCYKILLLGTELVHDNSEKCLLREVEYLRIKQKELQVCLDKCRDQVKFNLNTLILISFCLYNF